MNLTVYKENLGIVGFSERHGFRPFSERIDEHKGQVEMVIAFPGQNG